jgi:hypothetical protein
MNNTSGLEKEQNEMDFERRGNLDPCPNLGLKWGNRGNFSYKADCCQDNTGLQKDQ